MGQDKEGTGPGPTPRKEVGIKEKKTRIKRGLSRGPASPAVIT